MPTAALTRTHRSRAETPGPALSTPSCLLPATAPARCPSQSTHQLAPHCAQQPVLPSPSCSSSSAARPAERSASRAAKRRRSMARPQHGMWARGDAREAGGRRPGTGIVGWVASSTQRGRVGLLPGHPSPRLTSQDRGGLRQSCRILPSPRRPVRFLQPPHAEPRPEAPAIIPHTRQPGHPLLPHSPMPYCAPYETAE